MACPICSSVDTAELYAGVADLEEGSGLAADYSRCRTCGALFQARPPAAEALQAMYDAGYRPLRRRGILAVLKSLEAWRLARSLGRRFPVRAETVVELGCGGGYLLRALRSVGIPRLIGVDWVISAAASTDSRGISFEQHDLNSFTPPENVDVVLAINVIEHLTNPADLLRRCRDRLSESGRIIVVTPNTASLAHSLFGRHWAGLHAPRHITVLSGKSMRQLAAESGFDILTVAGRADFGGWAISVQNKWRARRRQVGKMPSFGAPAMIGLALTFPLALIEGWTSRSSSICAVLTPRPPIAPG